MQLLGDTAEFTFNFSAPLTLNATRCFLDKLIIVSSDNDSSPSYQPLYPGLCQDMNNSNVVVAYLDPRDFRPSLNLFRVVNTVNILTLPGMEFDFIPLVDLMPISIPLRASELTLNLEPRMDSFDIDYNTNRIILHFTDYMDLSTFQPSQFYPINPLNGQFYQFNMTTVSLSSVENPLRTICFFIGTEDVAILQGICSSADACGGYFSSRLVSSHTGIPVQTVSSSLPLPVSSPFLPYKITTWTTLFALMN